MATLPTQSFTQLVTNTIAGIQGRASKLVNFSIGSTLRAIVEGFAGLFLWFQAMVLAVLKAMRLSTAAGSDVDTFTADFMPVLSGSQTTALPGGTPRLAAQAATGTVTYARFTAAPSSCFIPAAQSVDALGNITNAGPNDAATCQTFDGTQNFVVVADPSNAGYSASLGGYTLASDVASIDVPVWAVIAGSAGNVQINTITSITSPVSGIDTVTNAAAFTNGDDQETDDQLKARFQLFIQSLREGTAGAIGYVIASIRVGMQWQIFNCQDPNGATDYGSFTVFVDDGSGAISTATLTSAQNAVFGIYAAGTRPQVLAATTLAANVTMQIATAAGYVHNTVVAQVLAAVTSYINGVGLGLTPAAGTLSYMKLAAVAFGIPGVSDVTNYTLNGSAGDLVPGMGQTIKSGSVVVS